jgi:hypothetical protein
MNMKLLPPAAKNLFEKRFPDFQKLFIHKNSFADVSRTGAVFIKRAPGRRRKG